MGKEGIRNLKFREFAAAASLVLAACNGGSQGTAPSATPAAVPRVQKHGADLAVDGAAAARSLTLAWEAIDADSCAVVEGCVRGSGQRRLLRFDGGTINLGDQDVVVGAPSEANPLFEYSPCHQHYHFKDYMLYELLRADNREPVRVDGTAIVARKAAFCIYDDVNVSGNATPRYTCDDQGLSVGWSDVYEADLDCQWLDVTGVATGKYLLRLTVNPAHKLSETDETNNVSEIQVTIP